MDDMADGSSNQRTKGAEVLLRSPKGETIECTIRLQFSTNKNEVKYEVALLGLDLAKSAVIHCNSQVVVRHINGDYEAKGEPMKEYLSIVKNKMGEEFWIKFVSIPRKENEQADCLAKATSAKVRPSPVKYYPSSNIPPQLTKWKYRSSL